MKKILFVLFATAAMAASAAKVKSVSVRTTDGFKGDTSDVLAYCEVKEGGEFSSEICARDVRALRETKRYDEVFVETKAEGDDVLVTYVIRRKLRFAGPIIVEGNAFWRKSKIEHLADLKDGQPIDDADLAKAAGKVREAYQKEFFLGVRVDVQVEPVQGGSGSANVRFKINEGPRTKLRSYEFTGNESISSKELRASFGQRPWWNPLGWFAEDPATPSQIAAARESVLRTYRDKGFLDASVGDPEFVADGKSGKTELVFPVKEGPRYTIGTVSVSGTTLFPAEDVITNNVSATTGKVAGAKALENAAHEVELFYGARGYADTVVNVKQMADASDPTVLNLVFEVNEGVPVEINEIRITGNNRTKDKVIRREIQLSPGDRMNEADAERAQRRLENLRYFSRVRFYTEKVPGGEAKDGKPEKRDLVYELEEQRTGNFGIGVGASSVDSVYGMFELSESNFDIFNPRKGFTGGGQKGRISVMAGPRIQTYEASVTEPWFLDRPLELEVEVYRRERWFDQYDTIRTGAGVGLSYPVKFWPSQKKAFGRLGFHDAVEFVQFDDVDDNAYSFKRGGDYDKDERKDRLYKVEEDKYGDAFENVFRIYWSNDTRDSFIVPTRGYRALVFGDICVGDNEWWKVGFSYSHYFNMIKRWNHVLSLRVRGETIDDFSGGVPIYDRLFLGGPRSIRGVDYREIGPRVWRGKHRHEAWGGKSLFCVTGEYSIPIVQYVRWAFFTDLGSVGKDAWDPEFGDNFCWSVGTGFRLDIPSFPIRLDLAVPIEKPSDGVEKKVFSFNIGFDF